MDIDEAREFHRKLLRTAIDSESPNRTTEGFRVDTTLDKVYYYFNNRTCAKCTFDRNSMYCGKNIKRPKIGSISLYEAPDKNFGCNKFENK